MYVNLFPKLVRQQNLISYAVLTVVTIGFLLFLYFELSAYFHFMDKIDSSLPGIVPSEQSRGNLEDTEKNFLLSVPKISLENIPIILNVDGGNKSAYNQALENGIAHFAGTALPGQQGNSFIFGHSSFYPSKPGNYKEVFRQLDRLELGDRILITSDSGSYQYTIIDKKIVNPKNTDVLTQTTDYRLTLMTCWPVYSTSKRLLIIGKKVD